VHAQTVNRVEYYFDTDPGFGNGISIPITAAPNLTRDFTIPLNSVSEGFHLLYVRAKSNGLWSIPISKPVFVQRNTQTTSTTTLRNLEYFFDTDPGFGNGIQLSVSGTTFDQLLILDLSTLTTGFHMLYVRARDQNGRWSTLSAKPFYVALYGTNVIAIEYFFDDGGIQSSKRIYTSFTPGKNVTIDFAAALDGLLPNTTYTIHLTAINADGQRSTEITHVFTTPAIICDPLISPVTTGASRCESGVVTLTATGATATQSYNWYVNATDVTPVATTTSSSFTTPTLNTTTSYYVAIVNGTCESSRAEVVATILNCNQPPVINPTPITVAAETTSEFDLTPLISDPDNNVDLTSLTIITPPAEATATLNGTLLQLDYSNTTFVGAETILLEVCDQLVSCTQQALSINVVGELEIYNALSPNGDLKNEIFYIRYIDMLPDTQDNEVSIFNRWGDVVFKVKNYNNQDRVFRGLNNNGNELPSGTYFYRIEFENRSPLTGYLVLKR